jgi:hypothetical protein
MSSTTYPYDLLKTDKNLSVKDIEKDPSIYIRTFTPESIIYKYKTDIDIFIKNNKLDINILKNNNLNTILKDISDKFKNILINLSKINEMKNFLQNLIKNDKNELNKNKKFIDLFILYAEKIQQINLTTLYNDNQYLYNPINNYTKVSFHNSNNKTQYFINKINDFNSENQDNVKILFDIISQGDCLNLSLPSIGIIEKNISNTNTNNFIDFISIIINYNDETEDIVKILPIKNLKIEKIISERLLNISKNKLININNSNNSNNFNIFNNEKFEKIIENLINSIEIKVSNIFYVKNDQKNTSKNKLFKNKLKREIKYEYLIPYLYNNVTKEVSIMKKKDIDSIKDFKGLIKSNKDLIKNIISNVFMQGTPEEKINFLKKDNVKNALASFLFSNIQLIYNIHKEYVNKIDDNLRILISSSGKKFGLLNIESAFEYTSLLNSSILKFKTVLLNNFYNLFLPSKIEMNGYGMKKNEYGCYIPEGKFLSDEITIINDYPFNIYDFGLDKYIIIDKLYTFITNIKDKYDVYSKDEVLGFGSIAFENTDLLKSIFKIFSNYYKDIQQTYLFDLYIIDLIKNNFVNKYIPKEIIKEELNFPEFSLLISSGRIINDVILITKLVNKFDNNLKKSTNYLIALIDLKNKIKNTLIPSDTLLNNGEIYSILMNFYYGIAMLIYNISEKYINDIDIKNKILKLFIEKIRFYENISKDYFKKNNK